MQGILQVRICDTNIFIFEQGKLMCSHLSSKLPLSPGNISIFKNTFTMLSHHPCCVFVAPMAIAGTWRPCIVDSFPLLSLESIQLLWFYSEVSALHI